MDLSTITVSDFKTFFRRDFPFLPADSDSYCDEDKYVLDSDIEKAFSEAQVVFNQALFGDDDSIRIAYLYLTAHYLANDLKAAAAGINGGGSFPVASRTVGSVSETYDIPQAFKDSPQFAYLAGSSYGMKYLSLLLPALVGNVNAIYGGTRP